MARARPGSGEEELISIPLPSYYVRPGLSAASARSQPSRPTKRTGALRRPKALNKRGLNRPIRDRRPIFLVPITVVVCSRTVAQADQHGGCVAALWRQQRILSALIFAIAH